jgi:hypothetical protein
MPVSDRPTSSARISAELEPELARALTRRRLLQSGALVLGAAVLWPRGALAHEGHDDFALPKPTQDALEKEKLVHVSPLKSNGKESRCHAEVWYFFDRGSVVIATATKGWKVQAAKLATPKARLWVGSYGTGAPTFLASAAIDGDPKTFERLLAAYGTRYPDEWGKWKPRFESSHADGSRTLIRYTPIGA